MLRMTGRDAYRGDDMEYHSHSTCCSWFYNSYDNIANNAGRSCEIIYTNVHKYNLFPWKIYICFSYSFFFNYLIAFIARYDNRGERMLVLKKKKNRKKRFWMEKNTHILTRRHDSTRRYSSKNKPGKLNRYESKLSMSNFVTESHDNYIER